MYDTLFVQCSAIVDNNLTIGSFTLMCYNAL